MAVNMAVSRIKREFKEVRKKKMSKCSKFNDFSELFITLKVKI